MFVDGQGIGNSSFHVRARFAQPQFPGALRKVALIGQHPLVTKTHESNDKTSHLGAFSLNILNFTNITTPGKINVHPSDRL